jgi:hypothetical protein
MKRRAELVSTPVPSRTQTPNQVRRDTPLLAPLPLVQFSPIQQGLLTLLESVEVRRPRRIDEDDMPRCPHPSRRSLPFSRFGSGDEKRREVVDLQWRFVYLRVELQNSAEVARGKVFALQLTGCIRTTLEDYAETKPDRTVI